MAVTWGLDPKAKAIRVYYEGESTIYEGMPLCYNWDTTDNWMGVSAADYTAETGTTNEGYQNEGKFIRVEDPAVDNFHAFAGVVAGSGKAGKTGPCALDIYIPNGAIVPVRVGVNTLVGRTIVGLQTGLSYLVAPIAVEDFKPLGVAMETDATLAGTPSIVLTKLEPGMFLSQNFSTDLYAGAGVGAASWLQGLNHLAIETAHTSGGWDTLRIATTASGIMAATGGACSINSYLKVTVPSDNTAAAVYYRATLSLTHLVGSVITNGSAIITGLHSQIGGSDDVTCGHASALWADYGLTGTITGLSEVLHLSHNGTGGQLNQMIYMRGGADCTYLMRLDALTGGGDVGPINDCTGNVTTDANDKAIAINIDGDTFYLIAVDSIPAG